jgi:hypothetical protein
MSKISDGATKVSTAVALAKLVFTKEGRPIIDRDKPGKYKLFGATVFERDADGKQHVLWFRIRDAPQMANKPAAK